MEYDVPPNGIEMMANDLTESLIQAGVITNAEDADKVFYAYIAELSVLEASL